MERGITYPSEVSILWAPPRNLDLSSILQLNHSICPAAWIDLPLPRWEFSSKIPMIGPFCVARRVAAVTTFRPVNS